MGNAAAKWMSGPLVVIGGLALLVSGCVEQTLSVESNPPGALVFLNDQEVADFAQQKKLSKEEAEKMRTEAEAHSEDDRRRMEEVEARNSLDGIVYQAEKMLRENREKIAEADVKKAEEAIEDAKKAVNEGGVPRLRAAKENVERSLHKIAEELYKTSQAAAAGQAGAAASAGAGGNSSAGSSSAQEKKPGDVIDAEYVDVDESKRPN